MRTCFKERHGINGHGSHETHPCKLQIPSSWRPQIAKQIIAHCNLPIAWGRTEPGKPLQILPNSLKSQIPNTEKILCKLQFHNSLRPNKTRQILANYNFPIARAADSETNLCKLQSPNSLKPNQTRCKTKPKEPLAKPLRKARAKPLQKKPRANSVLPMKSQEIEQKQQFNFLILI